MSNRFISIDIDCNLTQDLINEGLAREVVNRVQKTRKDINLEVSDRITVVYKASEGLKTAIEKHRDYIMSETLTTKLEGQDSVDEGIQHKIEDFELTIFVSKN